ncbi:MAG TPA: alpha/beta hydrolase [Terriglobales bacterium]|jgi:pimeloyl-ACP methyl ester carboxylesterase|nr:alpha/beta hydrolase [Terriglobales bacterium]
MPNVKLPSGADLYFETHGNGEPLVLIPSTGFSAEAWKPSQLPLAQSTTLILHDPRGCGRSVATQQVYTIPQMANDVVALLDHLQIPSAHLVGHSMGGRIALELALDFPGRVKSLIMAASGSGQVPRPGPDCIPGLPHWLVIRMVEKGFEKACREEYCDTSAFFTDSYRKQNPEKIEAFFQAVWPTHAKLSEYIHLIIARHNWEATHRLADVQCPTLILIGDNDSARSNHLAQGESLKARIRGAELKLLKGQSHGFFWQAPEETNQTILQWVAAHGAK